MLMMFINKTLWLVDQTSGGNPQQPTPMSPTRRCGGEVGLLSTFRVHLRLHTFDLETKPVHQVVCSLEISNLFLAHRGTSKEGPYWRGGGQVTALSTRVEWSGVQGVS